MDIFVSYRRGTSEAAWAARIAEYLAYTHGLDVFFDRSERANPSGAPFPNAIAEALTRSRLTIAVIDLAWIAQAARLFNQKDWVRSELICSNTGLGRDILPVYIGVTPAMLQGVIPPELAFLGLLSSHLQWVQFQDAEKKQLSAWMRPMLPGTAIEVKALRLACADRLPRRLDEVMHLKFAASLYVGRQADVAVAGFVAEPARHLALVQVAAQVLERMRLGADLAALPPSALSELCKRLALATSIPDALEALAALESAFRFDEVEECQRAIQAAITADRARFDEQASKALRMIRRFGAWTAEDGQDALALLQEQNRRFSLNKKLPERFSLLLLLERLPSERLDSGMRLANDVIKDLRRSVAELQRPCLAIVDRAGRGKTNIAAYWCARLAPETPVILFGGYALREQGGNVAAVVQAWLDREFADQFSHWQGRAAKGLDLHQRWMYLVIDGLEEVPDPVGFGPQFAEFLARLSVTRIRVIVTCRDIFWDIFAARLKDLLHGGRALAAGDFTDAEREAALAGYLASYRIDAQLGSPAQETLRHPLFLKLFCEANRGKVLGRVEALRETAVFHDYVESGARAVADRAGWAESRLAREALLQLARRSWLARSRDLPLADSGIEDSGHPASLRVNLLAQGLLRESAAPKRRVGILYDELLEFLLASSWSEQAVVQGASTLDAILDEVARDIDLFPAGVGAILCLDRLRESDGRLVNALLERLQSSDDEVVLMNQASLLQALEGVHAGSVSDRVIALIGRLECRASPAVRVRLGSLIVGLRRLHPERPALHRLVERVLELDEPMGKHKDAHGNTQVAQELEEQEDDTPRLPEARFHHATDTRLNAIALLVGGTDADRAMAQAGLQRLGRVELSAALRAVRAVDVAEDDAVLAAIPGYLEQKQAEYRLYAAWLLRQRHGPLASRFLLGLLLDADGRVRDYTRRILRHRPAEPEFITGVVEHLAREDLPTWSRMDLIHALAAVMPAASTRTALGSRVVDCLLVQLSAGSLALRVQAGRALATWNDALSDVQLQQLATRGDETARRIAVRESARRVTPPTATRPST